ncbi:uncharacterized protein JCM6883_001399 [Sporobolomyces salmoneus]|uniref:uncharacterized protein n=1 Tax=Sporobolomyces salmoneus TaxID=183962 RepID=UPI00317759C4
MDRLPFELLTHIANCLSLEPLPPLRQTSLSYLSRANKTLLLATRPILYRDPVLLSDWRARIYENSFSKNVNPWLLTRARQIDKQWWMPRSVCDAQFNSELTQRALKRTGLDSQLNFEYPEPSDACCDKWYGSPSGVDFVFSFGGLREIPSFVACRHEFIWSNLTSVEISEYALDDGFLTGQFGPGRNSRKMLQSLSNFANPSAGYYPFLFDAIHFLDAGHFLRDVVKKGVEWPSNNDEEGLEDWERHEGGQRDEAAWEWAEAGPNLVQKARFDYGVWQQYINLKALSNRKTDKLAIRDSSTDSLILLELEDSILISSFTDTTGAPRRNSITFDSSNEPLSNLPRPRPSSPGFSIDFPRVQEQQSADDRKLAPSVFGYHEHDPRLSPPQPSVLARPSLSPARSRPSLTRPKPTASLPSNVSRDSNPQRLLTPQDPAHLELFPAPSPPPPATIVPSAVSTSKPSILSHGQPHPHPFVVPSSLPLSPVSPELSREPQLPLPSSPVIDKDSSQSKENPLFLAPSLSLTSKSSDGGLEESHTTTGLGIELGEEGEVGQILERSKGESKEAVSGGTGEDESEQDEAPSPPAKRRKVQFVERQKDQEK